MGRRRRRAAGPCDGTPELAPQPLDVRRREEDGIGRGRTGTARAEGGCGRGSGQIFAGTRAAGAAELGWLARCVSERWRRERGGYKTEIEDGPDTRALGSDFFLSFLFFQPTQPR